MTIKTKVIKFLSPIRRFYSEAYIFILSAYIGKIVIILNQIDHFVIDWIFYYFVFSPKGKTIQGFYKNISSNPMGTKLHWLQELYKGKMPKIKSDINSPSVYPLFIKLANNRKFNKIIRKLDILIRDTRNPLIHSSYFLGYGNEYKWDLSYHRFYFNKYKDEFDNSPFTIKEAKAYLKIVQRSQKELTHLYFQLFNEIYPM